MKGAYHLLRLQQNRVIPNLRSEGAQERDLMKLVPRNESDQDRNQVPRDPGTVSNPRYFCDDPIAG